MSDVLWRHLRFFPVVAEIAEFYLGSGLWKFLDNLCRELDRRGISFKVYDEKKMLQRLRILGTVEVGQQLSLHEFEISPTNFSMSRSRINYNRPVEVSNA